VKILFCCEFYAPSIGGIQEVMQQIAERLVSRGHDVTVATSQLQARTFTELNGVRVVGFDVSGNFVKGLDGEVTQYRNFVSAGDFDVVLINMAQQWTLDALIPILENIPYRKVLIPCGFSCFYEPSYAAYFHQMPNVLRQFDHLIFHASDYRDICFAQKYGLKQFSVIPNGASETEFAVERDPTFRKRWGISDQERLFLTVGAFTVDKGHADLLRSYLTCDFGKQATVLLLNANVYIAEPGKRNSAASETSSELLTHHHKWGTAESPRNETTIQAILSQTYHRLLDFIRRHKPDHNPPPFRDEMQSLLKQLNQPGTNKRVVVTDMPRPELVQAYMNTDLFVFASHIEYSPLVLFEAAAAGTAFLSAQVGNAHEIAEWTGAGMIGPSLIDHKGYTRIDSKPFAERWVHLSNDGTTRRELGRNGKRNWAARFTWQHIAQQYESVLHRVCTAPAVVGGGFPRC
jgi:glycosyltransferase involved in cell wall biosynthesis